MKVERVIRLLPYRQRTLAQAAPLWWTVWLSGDFQVRVHGFVLDGAPVVE